MRYISAIRPGSRPTKGHRDGSRLHGDVKAWLLCHGPPVTKTGWAYLLQCNKMGDGMLEGVEPRPEPVDDWHSGGWRGIASAWALVLLLVILFAGTQALASRRIASASPAQLAGAVIPRHDPASAVVGVPCAAPLEECGRVAPALIPDIPYPYPVW